MAKETLYLVRLGRETHLLKIADVSEENNSGERKYRLRIPANHEGEGKTICGSSEMEAALCGAEFLLSRSKRHAGELASGDSRTATVH